MNTDNYNTLSPTARASYDYRHGEGHDANPYPKGTAEREQYMMEMGRLQDAEMRALREELRAGV